MTRPATKRPLPPDRGGLLTERSNPAGAKLDTLGPAELVAFIQREDANVARAVANVRAKITAAVELVAAAFEAGGRLIYVGAGTSGRLGVLDASECPPTFCTPPAQVQAIIAGGRRAVFRAVEGAEDDASAGAASVDKKKVGPCDVVFGIAAGGTTPFVHGALAAARRRRAQTVLLACVPGDNTIADVCIRPLVGPEVVTGSTRMKAGTACKMVLNTVTTAAMIRLGKVYGNLMVDLAVTNEKLRDRAIRIVGRLTGLDRVAAAELIERAGGRVKTALVMCLRRIGRGEAERLIRAARGGLRRIVGRKSNF
jgi:N-acetylmuramic acid 6-phosphate etherase